MSERELGVFLLFALVVVFAVTGLVLLIMGRKPEGTHTIKIGPLEVSTGLSGFALLAFATMALIAALAWVIEDEPGPPDGDMVAVPMVYNHPKDRAVELLKDAGFHELDQNSVCSSSVLDGRVREVVLDNGADVADETSVINSGGVAIARLPAEEPLLVKVSNGHSCDPGKPDPTEGPHPLTEANLLGAEELSALTNMLAAMPFDEVRLKKGNPTLDCEAEKLASLGREKEVDREFDGQTIDGVVYADAAISVLQFGTPEKAQHAFDKVTGWITRCDERLPGAREPFDGPGFDAVGEETTYGRSFRRIITSPAPEANEACPECVWVDTQAVALVGDRLALVSVASIEDTGAVELDSTWGPMAEVIKRQAELAAS